MLVFSRRIGEQIVVPSCDLTLKVVSISGTRVQLTISAPRSIAVHRTEVNRHVSDDSPQRGLHARSHIEPIDLR
jgi:carbon storage regulator CsrA